MREGLSGFVAKCDCNRILQRFFRGFWHVLHGDIYFLLNLSFQIGYNRKKLEKGLYFEGLNLEKGLYFEGCVYL